MTWRVQEGWDLEPLGRVWERAAGGQSIFQSFTFARHWAACFGGVAELRVGWQDDPPAIVPLTRRAGAWGLVGGGLFDYLDVIGAAGRAAAEWVMEQTGGQLQVSGVPQATPHAAFWGSLRIPAQPFAAAPVRAAGPEDDLLRQHPRQQRRWQAAGVELVRVEAGGARRRHLDWMLEHKATGLAARAQTNVLGAAEANWLARMVEREPGVCELWALRRSGDTLAGLLCWLAPTLRYAYTIAYEPLAAAMSPGILALYALLRHTMREGRGFNFLTGEQDFKLRFATGREPLLRYATYAAIA